MNVDLFDRTTVSYEVADDLFGIQDEHPAIVTTEGDAKEWNAVVRNSSGDKITFVPLDHQIVIKPTPSTTYSLCDCMLYRDKYWLAVVVDCPKQDSRSTHFQENSPAPRSFWTTRTLTSAVRTTCSRKRLTKGTRTTERR